MNVYLDASALVKRYVTETGSREVGELIETADSLVTAVVSRAEVSAALGKASRLKALTPRSAALAREAFQGEWPSLGRLPITESVVARADILSWELHLRGYDAVHLAVAALWQEMLGRPIVLATFDRQLWSASKEIGLVSWPESLA